MKSRQTKPKPTHFEQVPVKVVKQIVPAEVPPKRVTSVDNLIVEPSSGKTEPYSTSVVRSAAPNFRSIARLEQLATSLFVANKSTRS